MNIDQLIKFYNDEIEAGYKSYKKSYKFQVLVTMLYFSQALYIPLFVLKDPKIWKIIIAVLAFVAYLYFIARFTFSIRKEEQEILKKKNLPFSDVQLFQRSYSRHEFFDYEVGAIKDFLRRKGLSERSELDILIKCVREKSHKDFNLYITMFAALIIPVWVQLVSKHIENSDSSLVSLGLQYLIGVSIVCFGVGFFKHFVSEIRMIILKPDQYRLHKLYKVLTSILITD